MEEMKEINQNLQNKKCIKYSARVREVNRQYEKNNNAMVDNGVYHKDDNSNS